MPDSVPEHRLVVREGKVFLPELLLQTGLAASKSEARRLLQQGAVEVDGQRIGPDAWELPAAAGASVLVKAGKRAFARVVFVLA